MANIPLSEIPNAPTAVFTPIADPHYQGDVVGDQAKADIRQGYQASMVNPEAAGTLGRGLTQLGAGIDRGLSGISSGMLFQDAANRRQQLERASVTGIQKFYQNQATVQNNYSDLMQGQDPKMASAMWLKAAGQRGENLLQGMDEYEQYAMTHNAMHVWGTGLINSNQQARNQFHLETETTARTTQNDLVKAERFPDAVKNADAALANRTISPQEHQVWMDGIQTAQQFSGLRDKVAYAIGNVRATGTLPADQQSDEAGLSNQQSKQFLQQVQDSFVEGKPLPGFEKLGAKDISAAYKIGSYLENQSMNAAQDSAMARIQSGGKISPDDLPKLPEWNQMDQSRQQAVRESLNNYRYGTPEAAADRAEILTNIQNFPTSKDPLQEATDIRNSAIAKMPDDDQRKDVLGILDSKIKEMKSNGGNLTPQTQVHQWLSQSLTQMLKNNAFGAYDPDLKGGTPDQLKKNLSALNVKEDVYEAVLAKNPKTRLEAQKYLDDMTRQFRAGAAAGGGASQPPQQTPLKPASWWSNFHTSNDGWNSGTSTWFGTSPEGKPDPEDNGNGKYAGTKTRDPNFQGASLSDAVLRAHGIDPENKDQVAQHEVEVRNGDKTVRVPIADLGPAKRVEARQGTTVDLTGAVHRALALKSDQYEHGAPIQWRIVPKNSNA